MKAGKAQIFFDDEFNHILAWLGENQHGVSRIAVEKQVGFQ